MVVTDHGKPMAVVFAVASQGDLERLSLAQSPQFQAIIDSANERVESGQVLTHEQVWQKNAAPKAIPARRRLTPRRK
jgi:hypothetical protein